MTTATASSTAEWESLAASTFVPLEVAPSRDAFAGRVDTRVGEAGTLTRVTSSPCIVSRTPSLVDSAADDVALFSLQVRGRNDVMQSGTVAHVDSGQGVLYLARRPYELRFPRAADLVVLQVSLDRLGVMPSVLERAAARSVRVDADPALRTYTHVIRTLFAPSHPEQEVAAVSELCVELLAEMLRRQLRLAAQPRSHRALFAGFDRIIAERLDDPSLDVALLATAENVSIRTVHNVFEQHGSTPAAFIRERRLDRTRYLLENTRIPLSDIAVMCGFGELSTFSRAFRRSSGVAPSQHRRAARERAASLSPAVA